MEKNVKLFQEYLREAGEKKSSEIFPEDLSLKLLLHAEKLLSSNIKGRINNKVLHDYLKYTGTSQFLQGLETQEQRYRWADTTFNAVYNSGYTLETMIRQRVETYHNRPLFYEYTDDIPVQWSYSKVLDRISGIAAAFYLSSDVKPKVAIIAGNSTYGACCDLACLVFDIFVTPLNVHFDSKTLSWIFSRLDINIVVTDSVEQYSRLLEIRNSTGLKFRIFCFDNDKSYLKPVDKNLTEECSRLSRQKINGILAQREKLSLNETATILFTSGSTGNPKGVCFSRFNLVTKRFARAAALPDVGNSELLLCYLPLFHTFGRYFEMLGMLYWGGTYVFAGNPSADTLLARMKQLHPTGLISIPLRWVQIREKYLKEAGDSASEEEGKNIFREIVGKRLRWGISAAGYLEPRVFHFFQRNGVELCSGFGMTEATGGITMTPPGNYMDNSVGIPLPGMETRFSSLGELQLSGPYIARYLPEDKGMPVQDPEKKFWLPTGDLFKELPGGHLQIVDRIKDIYKNNRGQTVAPGKVEQKFDGVPGIKHAFLAGDGKAYNVLLIVPDNDDPVIKAFDNEEAVFSYINKIITTANQELAPYERVVNFELLDRDFDSGKKELTPKGSFSRKIIVQNFSELINRLYAGKYLELEYKDLIIRIPRWFYRDQGILENGIFVRGGGLYNRYTKKHLKIRRIKKDNAILIGSLKYRVTGNEIDLGLFSRQPMLWTGNPELIDFCPVKEGWDLDVKNVSTQLILPERKEFSEKILHLPGIRHVENTKLEKINDYTVKALFAEKDLAVKAIEHLESFLTESDNRMARLIRRRLEMLSRHPVEDIRCMAYRILLLDNPAPDYSAVFPAFVESGLQFLNEMSIEMIADAKFESIRLESLRKRLFQYRTQLKWPAPEKIRKQFERIFDLLFNFARRQSQYYAPVRAELASWSLHKADRKVSNMAQKHLFALSQWFESTLEDVLSDYTEKDWAERIVFDDRISKYEIDKLKKVLFNTTFLKQSVLLAFDVRNFSLNKVPSGGIWISRILSRRHHNSYRMSINNEDGKHYDLLLIVSEKSLKSSVMEISKWLIALSLHSSGLQIIPRFGCYRPDLGALSLVYYSDLTVWDKIREISAIRQTDFKFPGPYIIKKMYVSALGAFFQGWINSGYRIVPGAVLPTNIAVTEPDFRESAKIHSLAHMEPYQNTLSLVYPMVQNFYRKTVAHYPWTKNFLEYTWIFDACIEKLGQVNGMDFLLDLHNEIKENSVFKDLAGLTDELKNYLISISKTYYVPLPLQNAINRFNEWSRINKRATSAAKEGIIKELIRLYHLKRYPEIARYHLYRFTYFVTAENHIKDLFDKLLEQMFKNPKIPAMQMVELSDLQTQLSGKNDRLVFSRLIFPRLAGSKKIEVLALGGSDKKQVVVRTVIKDKAGREFFIREPLEPAEIGEMYRLFLRVHFQKTVSEQDCYFVVLDSQEQIIGGVCYRYEENGVVHLDGIAVSLPLKGKSIKSSILEDFCVRLSGSGIKYVKTHFFHRRFYQNHGFKVDKKWGGLIRYVGQDELLSEGK